MKYKISRYEKVSDFDSEGESILTIVTKPNQIEKLFGFKEGVISYQGSCTVWYNTETFKRASTLREGMLSDMEHSLSMKNSLGKDIYFEESLF